MYWYINVAMFTVKICYVSRSKSVSNRLKKDINSRPVSEKAYQQGPYTAHAMASSPVWNRQSSSPRLSNVHISPSSTLLLDGTYAGALIKSNSAKNVRDENSHEATTHD